MKRRSFVSAAVSASAAAGLASGAPAEPAKNAFFDLRYFYMRTGSQVERTTQYLRDVFLPAAKRAGLGLCGRCAFHRGLPALELETCE